MPHTFRKSRRVALPLLAGASVMTIALLGNLEPSVAQTDQTVGAIDVPLTQQVAVSYADLVERVAPAVVSVQTTRSVGPRSAEMEREFDEEDMPDMFRRFFEERGMPDMFRRFFEEGQPRGDNFRGQPMQGVGSGFIIDPEGYVVTNNHVIDGAEEIQIVLQDGRELPAELVGRDARTDLALLKVEPEEPLPVVEWGDSDSLRIGDPVVAVGNPFGLGGTVTTGILSARGRDIGSGPYDDFLQIDAAINRGNSGGPTFDVLGRVIGVNTAIYGPGGGNVGIGFAIPATLARDVVAELRDEGQVTRGWLGVQIQNVDDDLAAGFGLDRARGALVSEVTQGSPAEDAGLERGDVILSFDGIEIEQMRELPRIVAARDPGDTSEVVVWRDGEEQTVEVELGKLPRLDQLAARGGMDEDQPAQEEVTPQLGLALAELTPELRQRFDIADDLGGVAVTEVQPNSPAAAKRMRTGDVLLEVEQQPVSSPQEVREIVREATAAGKDAVLALVHRDGSERFVALRLSTS